MTLQSSGPISFDEIATEFGSPTDNKFGNYRVSQTIGALSNVPLDTGIPGPDNSIKFSDFYGKSLNVVVDCHSGSDQNRINAKTDKWNNDFVTVVGGFRGKKQSGSKIIIHVNKKFGSQTNDNQNICALKTGTWSGIVDLRLDMGANGVISGAGGKGGDGDDGYGNVGPVRYPHESADKANNSWNGKPGNSGLGIQYNPTTVNVPAGTIQCGYGGGAAGRGSRSDEVGDRTACSGGGGGGAGLPAGAAGEGGRRRSHGSDEVAAGADGGTGSISAGGAGGAGGDNAEESIACTGGNGRDTEDSGGPDCSMGPGNDDSVGWYYTNGSAGSNGAAIRRVSGYTVTVNVSGSGSVNGNQTATGVA